MSTDNCSLLTFSRRCKIHPRGEIYRYEIGVSLTVQFFLRQCNSRWSCCSYYYKAQISDINPKSTRSAIQRRCLINSLDKESNLKVLHILGNCYNTVDRKNHSIYLEEITIYLWRFIGRFSCEHIHQNLNSSGQITSGIHRKEDVVM